MIDLFLAYQDTTEPAATGSGWTLLFTALFLGVVFYFLMIRPQRKRMQQHQAIVSVIEHLGDDHAILRTEGGGRLRVLRRAIAGKVES
jgi:cbb3-type cytochrome oxidase subunit 3